MPVSGIQKLTIKNFKAFRNKEEFEINGRHLLIYGENGSGKSSLYFALYTLLQCASKTEDRIIKYFDLDNPENLVNIHNPDTEDAYVHLTLTNNPDKSYKISSSGLEGNDDTLQDVNLASDFISHRLLINFYNFRNSKEINLFPVFDRDIWPFTSPPGKAELFDDTIKILKEDIIGLERKDLSAFKRRVANLNKNISTQINNINEKATTFLSKHFFQGETKYTIKLDCIKQFWVVGKTREYKLLNPHIKLSLVEILDDGSEKPIDRPQSYLNEAKLTAIGLTIRFVILQERPVTPDIKLLALDDLLISLDMQHRMQVIDIIFNEFNADYQLILLTHDYGFYREVKRRTFENTENWKYLEFYEDGDDKHPCIKEGKIGLEKAVDYIKNKDFQACAVELRKTTEDVLKNFCEKKMDICFDKNTFITLGQYIKEAKNIIDRNNFTKYKSIIESSVELKDEFEKVLSEEGIDIADPAFDGLTNKKKGKLIGKLLASRQELFSELFDFLILRKEEELEARKILNEIEGIKNRVLNHGAHASDAPLYAQELQNAMETIKRLQNVLKNIQ